jgi:hypothetical protein
LPKFLLPHKEALGNLIDNKGFLKIGGEGGELPESCSQASEADAAAEKLMAGLVKAGKLKEAFTAPSPDQWSKFYSIPDMKQRETRARFAELENPQSEPRWHDPHIPYCFRVGFPAVHRGPVVAALNILSTKTKIRFVSKRCGAPGHKIEFIHGVDIRPYSYVGIYDPVGNVEPNAAQQANHLQIANNAPSSLQPIGVNSRDYPEALVYVHELMHALGFAHTQQRSDWNTCYTGNGYDDHTEANNCAHLDAAPVMGHYDFESVMHYPTSPPDLNCAAIEPVDPKPDVCHGNPANMGRARRLAAGDIASIDALYPNHDAANFL